MSVFSGELQELLVRVGTHVETGPVPTAGGYCTTSRAGPCPHQILFADDNADMRDYTRRRLEEQYEFEIEGDGQAALERILANPPALVLVDVMMPRLEGFASFHRLRADEHTRTLPLIMLWAHASEEVRV